MKIRLVPKKNPQKREEVKFYANPVNLGHKSLDDIARDIAGRSSLTRGDVSNVLYNFIDCLPIISVMVSAFSWGSLALCVSHCRAKDQKQKKPLRPRRLSLVWSSRLAEN